MKIHIKEKHRELCRHYARFIDKRWYPNFTLSDDIIKTFICVESSGRASCSKNELTKAVPLFNGKINRELTIKLLFDEMADWWASRSGWWYPIAHTIQTEMWSHGLPKRDCIYIRALIKIMRSCRKDGFMETMLSFTGMTQRDKDRYIDRKFA